MADRIENYEAVTNKKAKSDVQKHQSQYDYFVFFFFQNKPENVEKKKKRPNKQKKGGKGNKEACSAGKKKHRMEGQVSGQVGQEQPQHLTKKV